MVLAALILISTTPAYAYLDPSTGSAIFQGVLAALAGLALVVKTYWTRIVYFFKRPKSAADDQLPSKEES